MIRAICSTIAALMILGCFIPYANDIIKGKVKPARATRIMFALLMIIVLLQQYTLHNGWLVAVTWGDAIGSLAILLLAFKYGIGGLCKVELLCYILLIVDVMIWLTTKNALLALHLSVVADMIAFTPTVLKTWRYPNTETPLFFAVGTVAPLLNIMAAGNYTYRALLFPFYLALVNGIQLAVIYRSTLSQYLARVPMILYTSKK